MLDSTQLLRAIALATTAAPSVFTLHASLRREGFLVDGQVRDLTTVEDGLSFVRTAAASLTGEWDLLDAFSTLDFGPWRDEGTKDINASLRSLGMFNKRWRGSKWDALWHPIPSRATAVMDYDRLLAEGVLTAAGLQEVYPAASLTASRLQVEVGVLEMYLRREEWWGRLWPSWNYEKQDEESQLHLGEGLFYGAAARRVSAKLADTSKSGVLDSPS